MDAPLLADGHRPPAPMPAIDWAPPRRDRLVPHAQNHFNLVSDFQPSGDQPAAIAELARGVEAGARDQVLLGVTGSGKTFTMAHLIAQTRRPALIMAPNKTLAAQLYSEMRAFFPHNAVEYFVSYYDYYTPEAYVPRTDTYIEKESMVNEQIDRMRHSATRALLERDDLVIVASVSCIFGIGSSETYARMTIPLEVGGRLDREVLIRSLVELQYQRNDIAFQRGTFRVRGETIELFPSHLEDRAWRISLDEDRIEQISEIDALTGHRYGTMEQVRLYPNSHYVTPKPTLLQAVRQIEEELHERLKFLKGQERLLEAQRLEQRTRFDLEMIVSTGGCAGIENYSRYLTGRLPGQPPPTLFEYLPEDALLIVDESHVAIPQIGGMFRGDYNRKATLAEHGFRLPSCVDNRPLRFEEWDSMRPPTVCVSATPGSWELERTGGVITEQVIRPTGLIDPPCHIHPTEHQIDHLIGQCHEVIRRGERVLVTTLTKKMAEALTEYLHEAGLAVRYLHSDIDTLERIAIVRDLRAGAFDVLVGINLLREGLDIPECALVAILDADKEGFLRSRTSLVQTIGRAARNVNGKVLLYADTVTDSMQYALDETARRRARQQAYNEQHAITPESVRGRIDALVDTVFERADRVQYGVREVRGGAPNRDRGGNIAAHIADLTRQMLKAAADLEFERAATLRDEIRWLEQEELAPGSPGLLRDAREGSRGHAPTLEAGVRTRKGKGKVKSKGNHSPRPGPSGTPRGAKSRS